MMDATSFNLKIRYYCPKCDTYQSLYKKDDPYYTQYKERLCKVHSTINGRKYLDVAIEQIIKDMEVLNDSKERNKRDHKVKPSPKNKPGNEGC
jgi:hypothetical protein